MYGIYVFFKQSSNGSLVKKALSVSKQLCRPSKLESHALNNLFPSPSYGPFDPTSVSCASSSQKKKKATNTQGRVQVM